MLAEKGATVAVVVRNMEKGEWQWQRSSPLPQQRFAGDLTKLDTVSISWCVELAAASKPNMTGGDLRNNVGTWQDSASGSSVSTRSCEIHIVLAKANTRCYQGAQRRKRFHESLFEAFAPSARNLPSTHLRLHPVVDHEKICLDPLHMCYLRPIFRFANQVNIRRFPHFPPRAPLCYNAPSRLSAGEHSSGCGFKSRSSAHSCAR